VIFPIVAALLKSRLAAAAAFCVFSLVSSLEFHALARSNLGSYAYMNLITQLPFFLSGILAYLVWRHDGFRKRPLMGNLLFLGVLVAAWSIVYVPMVFMFLMSFSVVAVDLYAWALVFAAFIVSICYWSNPLVVNPVTRYLGKISFSMYLLHPLLIVLLLDVHKVLDRALGGGLLGFAGRATLMLSVVSLAGSVTYRLIEKPAVTLGKKLAARVPA
jgi:peptidoglycan/LPS O-acetylase OafA/YrhL